MSNPANPTLVTPPSPSHVILSNPASATNPQLSMVNHATQLAPPSMSVQPVPPQPTDALALNVHPMTGQQTAQGGQSDMLARMAALSIQPPTIDIAPTTPFVNYRDFSPASLTRLQPQPKENKSDPANVIKYHETQLQYNYGTPQAPRVFDLYLQTPILHSDTGIIVKQEKGGRTSYSLAIRLPATSSPEVALFISKIKELYRKCCFFAGEFKGIFGLEDYNPERPGSAFGSPIYISKDKVTGEPIAGRDSSIYFKLIKYKTSWGEEASAFYDTNKKARDWRDLINAEIDASYILHIKHIYTGAKKCSIQIKVKEAALRKVIPRNSAPMQGALIDEFKTSQPDQANALLDTLSRVEEERSKNSTALTNAFVAATQEQANTPGQNANGQTQNGQPPAGFSQGYPPMAMGGNFPPGYQQVPPGFQAQSNFSSTQSNFPPSSQGNFPSQGTFPSTPGQGNNFPSQGTFPPTQNGFQAQGSNFPPQQGFPPGFGNYPMQTNASMNALGNDFSKYAQNRA